MTEDHGLSNGNGAINVGECLELVLHTLTADEKLLNVVQTLFLSPQTDDHRVGHHGLGKLHHFALIGS